MSTIEMVPIDSLKPHPENYRRGDIEAIRDSIRANQFYGVVVVQESTRFICAGNHRWEAARLEGLTEIRAEIIDMDDATAKRILAADNGTSDRASNDNRLLAELLANVREVSGSLEGSGHDDDRLRELLADLNKKDPWNDRAFRPMPDARGLTTGEVWDVGPHRLVIGDARDDACWAALPQAQLVIMDPPYGIDYGGGGLEREAIEGDSTPEEAIALLEAVAGQVVAHAESGAAVFTFLACGGDCFPPMLQALAAVGLARWHLVWVKNNATFGRADFQFQHENIAYGWTPTGGERLRPVEDRTLTSVWRVDRPAASKDHPTAKPVEVCSLAVQASSRAGDVVMDPFAGSGSSLVAAAMLGRIATGIELRPEYARVTLDRLEVVCETTAARVQ